MSKGVFFNRTSHGSLDSRDVESYLSGDDLRIAQKLISSGLVTVALQSWQVSPKLVGTESSYPQLYRRKPSSKNEAEIKKVNEELKRSSRLKSYVEFAKRADIILPRLFAPNIEGLGLLRDALALQLFARDNVHILCLTDSSVGVGAIAASAVSFHPVGVYSDATKLASPDAVWEGADGQSPGIIASANQGIYCVHRFDKLNDDSRAAILQVMNKEFLSYKTGVQTSRIPLTTRILAVSHPNVDSFIGKNAGLIKQQVSFDFSIVSSFHLTFLIQRNEVPRFGDLKGSQNDSLILKEHDIAFIRAFVSAAEDRSVLFSKEFQPLIVAWTSKLKSRGDSSGLYLQDITQNSIIAVVRLAQARARMKWRTDVALEDLKVAMDLVQTALEIR